MQNQKILEKKININFKDKKLLSLSLTHKSFNKSYNNGLKSILNSSEKWLKNLHMFDEIFGNKLEIKEDQKSKLNIDFDFPNWLSNSHLPFDQFKKHSNEF